MKDVGFFIGDLDVSAHHNPVELFAALVVSLIVTVMKLGERTQRGAVILAASLVADLQLIIAATAWAYYDNVGASGLTGAEMATVVSLSGGALVARGILCTVHMHCPPETKCLPGLQLH